MSNIPVSIFLPEGLFEEMRERAKLENVTISELVEIAVYEYFDCLESEEDFPPAADAPESNDRDPNKH